MSQELRPEYQNQISENYTATVHAQTVPQNIKGSEENLTWYKANTHIQRVVKIDTIIDT